MAVVIVSFNLLVDKLEPPAAARHDNEAPLPIRLCGDPIDSYMLPLIDERAGLLLIDDEQQWPGKLPLKFFSCCCCRRITRKLLVVLPLLAPSLASSTFGGVNCYNDIPIVTE